MPLTKLIFFLGSGLGHVGQIVEAGLVDLQAFFSQIKTREERNVSEGQASVRLCLKTAARLNAIFDFSPSVQRWWIGFTSAQLLLLYPEFSWKTHLSKMSFCSLRPAALLLCFTFGLLSPIGKVSTTEGSPLLELTCITLQVRLSLNPFNLSSFFQMHITKYIKDIYLYISLSIAAKCTCRGLLSV